MASFNDVLGLVPGDAPDSVVLDATPEHEIAPGTVHFAVLATLAEVSAARVVAAPVVPAQVSLNLLSRAATGRLVGKGRLIRRGRTLSVAEGEVFQGEKLVARATVTFAMV